jgi:endogenous inhibitor of DNA gyrase (YacG/DUF329 family)
METIELGSYEFVAAEYDQLCWNCNTPTRLIEIDFQAPLCSVRCADAKWNEFAERSREMEQEGIAGGGL